MTSIPYNSTLYLFSGRYSSATTVNSLILYIAPSGWSSTSASVSGPLAGGTEIIDPHPFYYIESANISSEHQDFARTSIVYHPTQRSKRKIARYLQLPFTRDKVPKQVYFRKKKNRPGPNTR